MKVIVLEDEPRAAARIQRLLQEVRPGAQILGVADSVTGAKALFHKHRDVELVLSDIQLADGLSFDALSLLPESVPIVFTTAFDQYALHAFKLHSIDYLLKPIEEEDLRRALDKLSIRSGSLEMLMQAFMQPAPVYKERFVVKSGDKIRFFSTNEIRIFFSEERTTWLVTDDKRRYMLDQTLEVVESQVDPGRFFRVNRKYLIAIDAIREIVTWSNSRLRLVAEGVEDDEIIVARERVQEFKQWLDR